MSKNILFIPRTLKVEQGFLEILYDFIFFSQLNWNVVKIVIFLVM